MFSKHAGRYLLVLALFVVALVAQAVTYPNLQNFSIPSPEPTLPAQFDTFTPPVDSSTPAANAAQIGEFTRSAGPDKPSCSPAATSLSTPAPTPAKTPNF